AVGRGELPSADVLQAAFPNIPRPKAPRRRIVERSGEGWFGLTKAIGLKFRFPGVSQRDDGKNANSIPIKGLKGDLPVRFAAKGGAVPGDRIVGIMEPGVGITIYPIHSAALKKFDDQPERWIDVRWDITEKNEERFPAQIQVSAINEPGTLAQVAQVIGERGGNIDNIKMKRVVEDYTDMLIDLEVWDLEHLNKIISGLHSKSVVSAVKRTHE
ncbi:MAG: RelA/SpoT AH/RIS domain-containing protein, partial [Methyloligellaceae bacterium]